MKTKASGVRKCFASIICVALLVVCSSTNIMASTLESTGLYQNNEKERSLLDDVDSVSDIQHMKARNGHLMYGSLELIKVSPTRARIAAVTQAYHVCPTIYMDIYVDKYDTKTGLWNQWRYWEYSTTNNDHLTKNMEIIVPSGYYYSVRGYHTCIHGNVMETCETITDGLYIGTLDKPIS